MRSTLAAFGLCSLLMLTGCVDNWSFLRKSPDNTIPPGKAPTAPELVNYLNQNSQRLRSMSCSDIDLDVHKGIQTFGGLTAKMACEQPRDFRMSASLMGKSEFELGSNDKEFWYWIARSDPPYQFFCSYEDLRTKKIALPFPFQPEWVMETLGMATYPVSGQYRVVDKRDTIELIQDTISLQGQPVHKVVVFNRQERKNRGQIRAYMLRDVQDKVTLCSAEIQDVQTVEGVVVPAKIVLNWPAEHTTLTMKLSRPTLNRVSPEMARNLFNRVPLARIQSFDLATLSRGVEDRNQLQQAGGFSR